MDVEEGTVVLTPNKEVGLLDSKTNGDDGFVEVSTFKTFESNFEVDGGTVGLVPKSDGEGVVMVPGVEIPAPKKGDEN